jgi:hypothetical protein
MAGRDPALVAEGVIAFSQARRALRAREAAGPGERLLAFLERYRALAPRRAKPRRDGRLDGLDARLPIVIAAIATPIADARASGAFANLWTVAGLRRDEVRTASVLGWLLDPRGSHGCGPAFAVALWSAARGEALGFDLSKLRRATTEVCPLGDQSNRVDVALEGDDFLVFVEVKVDAGLQPDQLQRYAVAATNAAALRGKPHAAVVYLAPWKAPLPAGCVHVTWRDVARAIRKACPAPSQATFIDQAALQFAAHVEKLH